MPSNLQVRANCEAFYARQKTIDAEIEAKEDFQETVLHARLKGVFHRKAIRDIKKNYEEQCHRIKIEEQQKSYANSMEFSRVNLELGMREYEMPPQYDGEDLPAYRR